MVPWSLCSLRFVLLGSLSTRFDGTRAAGKPNWDPNHLPNKTEPGQFGYNRCGNHSSQTSNCQTLYVFSVNKTLPVFLLTVTDQSQWRTTIFSSNRFVNSLTDFCVWAPPSGRQQIGNSEEYEVAWCTQPGHGTRLIPEGALRSAHFLSTPVSTTGSKHVYRLMDADWKFCYELSTMSKSRVRLTAKLLTLKRMMLGENLSQPSSSYEI